MQYMGGKARIARRIVEAILEDTPNRTRWVEPFVGGAWVLEHAAPHFEELYAGDVVPDLKMLYDEVGNGWEPLKALTREDYLELKLSTPSALRAFAGFGCSFGGKWFGGFCGDQKNGRRTYQDLAQNNLLRRKDVFARTTFKTQSYSEWEIQAGDVVYCDPPYANTTPYDATEGFDHDEFWKWCQEQVGLGADVYVSEYNRPEGVPVEEIWSRSSRQTMGTKNTKPVRVERLFKVL